MNKFYNFLIIFLLTSCQFVDKKDQNYLYFTLDGAVSFKMLPVWGNRRYMHLKWWNFQSYIFSTVSFSRTNLPIQLQSKPLKTTYTNRFYFSPYSELRFYNESGKVRTQTEKTRCEIPIEIVREFKNASIKAKRKCKWQMKMSVNGNEIKMKLIRIEKCWRLKCLRNEICWQNLEGKTFHW